VHNNITIINNHPAITGKALLLSLFIMPGFHVVHGSIGKRVEHAVTGAVADNKIVCKGDNFLQVYQNYIFTFFIFKGIYNFTSKFKCVQVSPHGLDNGAENNFV
jgi:hypothetical protein